MLLSLGLGWPGPLQALNNLKIPPPSCLRCCSLAFTAGSHSQSLAVRAVSRQVRSKVRGLLCFVSESLSKTIYLISLTELSSVFSRWCSGLGVAWLPSVGGQLQISQLLQELLIHHLLVPLLSEETKAVKFLHFPDVLLRESACLLLPTAPSFTLRFCFLRLMKSVVTLLSVPSAFHSLRCWLLLSVIVSSLVLSANYKLALVTYLYKG